MDFEQGLSTKKYSISALIVDQEEDVGILVILGAGILGALLMLIIIGKQCEHDSAKTDQAVLDWLCTYVAYLIFWN